MKKRNRQELLKKIVQEKEIETQDELLQWLKQEGIDATQATISRDIRQLNLVKVRNKEGKTVYSMYQQKKAPSNQHLKEMVQEMVEKVDRVQFMTILHTSTSSADLIAALLDELKMDEIVATMAGFDTLLIISPDEKKAQIVYDEMIRLKNTFD